MRKKLFTAFFILIICKWKEGHQHLDFVAGGFQFWFLWSWSLSPFTLTIQPSAWYTSVNPKRSEN
ncbi:MAG TPA: hypothetical protein VMH87_00550, partial [Pseudomonadales bacterium]|nr:hypothetical protein [Pseudomonadales bacterium]